MTSILLQHITIFCEWKKKHREFIELEFGKEGENIPFVTGIIVAPSFSVAIVPLLQHVLQADAVHMKLVSIPFIQFIQQQLITTCCGLCMAFYLEMKTRVTG